LKNHFLILFIIVKIYSPFKNTKQFSDLESTVDGIVAAYMFSIGLSFIPASLITFAVKEREE
jgi:ATP-binding cassette subfamily A (ABC1) protein 3